MNIVRTYFRMLEKLLYYIIMVIFSLLKHFGECLCGRSILRVSLEILSHINYCHFRSMYSFIMVICIYRLNKNITSNMYYKIIIIHKQTLHQSRETIGTCYVIIKKVSIIIKRKKIITHLFYSMDFHD